MDFKDLEQRLLKIAQTLEANKADISAARIRKLAAQLGKLVQEYPSAEAEKERIISNIKRRILGVKIQAEIQSSTDIIYYDIEFRTGTKVIVSQALGEPTKTMHRETERKPFTVSLVKKDETTGREKLIPSGTTKSEDELIRFLQMVSIGSEKELAQLSKEKIYRSSSDVLDTIANTLEDKGLVKEALKLDEISNKLDPA